MEANSKVYETERDNENFLLLNEGDGDFIKSWSVSGLAQPTAEQLSTYESAANTFESNVDVWEARKSSYGDIGDQLDEIFKDIDAWKARIQTIKNSNPKS